jgi:hypothetical protein
LLGAVIDYAASNQHRLLGLPHPYDLSVYDAACLELAIRPAIPLAAQEGALAGAALLKAR